MTVGEVALKLRIDGTSVQRLCRWGLLKATRSSKVVGGRRHYFWAIDAKDAGALNREIQKSGTRAAYAARRAAIKKLSAKDRRRCSGTMLERGA